MTTMAEYEEAVANGDTINDQGGPTMPTDRSETARPTPYYEDGQVAIYHGDCREIMPAPEWLGVCARHVTGRPNTRWRRS